MKSKIKTIIWVLFFIGVLIVCTVLIINLVFINKTSDRIYSLDSLQEAADDNAFSGVDCILVLGAAVKPDGRPSNMLEDRIITGIRLYESGISNRLLMSGDHGGDYYNEVSTMKNYAINSGVPSWNIFLDHAGFSTYESIYRAKEIFGANKIIIVSQKYHLYRALYIADMLGVEAVGVSADLRTYANQIKRDVREVLARVKDFAFCMLKPEPTYLGNSISLDGNGDVTNE